MNRQDDRLDLSALAPGQERWRRATAGTLLRVDAVLAHRTDALSMIAEWRRPLLIAASATLALLVPVELALESREPEVEQVRRLVSLTAEWQPGESPPTGVQFLRALTEEDAP